MTVKESERIAILEQRLRDMARQLEENTADTKAIRHTLDNLTGGKQALVWMAGIVVAAVAAVGTWLGYTHK